MYVCKNNIVGYKKDGDWISTEEVGDRHSIKENG